MLFETPGDTVVMLISLTLAIGLALMFSISLKFVMVNKTMMELGFGIMSNHYQRTAMENLRVVFGQSIV